MRPAVDLCVAKTQVIVLIHLGENITMELEMLKGLMLWREMIIGGIATS